MAIDVKDFWLDKAPRTVPATTPMRRLTRWSPYARGTDTRGSRHAAAHNRTTGRREIALSGAKMPSESDGSGRILTGGVMRRRDFLRGLTAASTYALSPRVPAQGRSPLRGVVIGGGFVGASIAMHLAEAGARVTLLEKSGPAKGATEKSFAWVNTYQDDAHYRALRLESLLAYRDLDTPLQLGITWGGYLNWTDVTTEADSLRNYATSVDGTPCAWRALTPAAVA